MLCCICLFTCLFLCELSRARNEYGCGNGRGTNEWEHVCYQCQACLTRCPTGVDLPANRFSYWRLIGLAVELLGKLDVMFLLVSKMPSLLFRILLGEITWNCHFVGNFPWFNLIKGDPFYHLVVFTRLRHAQRWGSGQGEHPKRTVTRLLSLSGSLCLELQRRLLCPSCSRDIQLGVEFLQAVPFSRLDRE